MSQFILEGREAPAFNDLDAFTQGYIEALFFTDTGSEEDGQLGQDAGFYDLAPEALADIVADCTSFQIANTPLLEEAYAREDYSEEQAGRDFWFTRNGHGVGYWDRPQLEACSLGDALSTVARAAGEVWTTLGDDGRVYHA